MNRNMWGHSPQVFLAPRNHAALLEAGAVQVILDRDIAILCGVETKVLNQAVKRNQEIVELKGEFVIIL